MMTLKSICAATGGAWAEVFPSTVFLLPAVWAGGLSGKRDTGAGWEGTGTGEHEEAQKSFGVHPHPWAKEENEAAEKRANENT